ncbi:AIPR family protein [Salinicola socius]|uniref:Abortive phage infection protein C-terminal domain-containing protein n=1 Tax=Salinicola socius TaxID=404433 RepID=A0A1Q8ST75_9GAMM|nr:AIPR family protein [Salinicola socius]OLO04623.1 hypothetical protein BTW07_07340 [Salinicola socius]
MKPSELKQEIFHEKHLKYYNTRSSDFSGRFLKWFLENILRLDEFETDDACVDAKHDKGIDAIYLDNVAEIVYIIQSKTKQNDRATLGDTDLKSFIGALKQFDVPEYINQMVTETKNPRLKQALIRNQVAEKVDSGYDIVGIFISNAAANSDAQQYISKAEGLELYDAVRIANEYVDLEIDGGVSQEFMFDVSDSDVITYNAGGASTKIFLAPALNLVKMSGISDGKLFEQNVRLSLGNTKVNKGLKKSISLKREHCNFPLYHNGINVLCKNILSSDSQAITVSDYVVVNGAQSLSSLLSEKSKITDDLKILVKLIEVKGDTALSQRITQNSNNQNAIKARDLKSNHNLQQRLKTEVDRSSDAQIAYEIKQGENNRGKEVIPNEYAGLILLALDLGQPWSCHQKYKIMDELHADIFGRPNVTGERVIALWKSFESVQPALKHIENRSFANYKLAQYFLAYSVITIIKSAPYGARLLDNLKLIVSSGKLDEFVNGFQELAIAAANDLNAELAIEDDENFDYKNDLKSQKWAKATSAKILAQYNKDVIRKKAEPIEEMFRGII